MSVMRLFVPMFVFLALSAACQANGADLSKTEAAKIVANLGDENVKIGAIVLGISDRTDTISSPNVARVLAVGVRGGHVHIRDYTFFYDKDIGWFYVEIVDDSGVDNKLRFWTANGYSEVTAKP